MYNQVIVVGGFNDLSAAHTVLERDTARSARDLAHPDLIKVLTGNSASVVEWLHEKFKLDLSLVSRLGGHTQPRTHPRLIKKARVTKLIKDGNAVIGVEYVKDGQTCKEYDPMILVTGGYAADFTENTLLKKYRPDIYIYPLLIVKVIVTKWLLHWRKGYHMEKVQVHPTGLVDLNSLWGVGGLLLNGEGKRFCDELGHPDYVTSEIWKAKVTVRLVLNSKASKEIEWHFKHYVGCGLLRKFSGEVLAKEIGISASQLKATFDDYNDIALAKRRILLARKFFHNVPITINDQFLVALMSPVLHYIMGGIDINAESEVRDMQEQVIPGLFASGEIAGGVHGAN
ncbi:FAD binding domain-containing protein [Gigaspora rosea]|uniref:FAD binding domain-containing protein n=1 Tax=Gigaspora rosea TaxID=44941 RepID=A0A397UR34_9GLOM|nr:FAD binding domain-containing protein [Gigaspora rosea]